MIIDGHAHVFPRLGTSNSGDREDSGGQGTSGDGGGGRQLQLIQHHVQMHVQGWRRCRDGSRADPSLLIPDGDAVADMPDVNLRVGDYGRLYCTVDNEEYFLQWYPCWFRDMTCRPELTIAYMDSLGVDMAVLQHDHVYGTLDEFLGECAQRFPNRFLPLAQIDAWESDLEAQIARLQNAVENLELKGLYFEVEMFSLTGWVDHLDDARFEPLWECVRRLGIPVFWYLCTSARDRLASYMDQVRRLDRWAQAHPDIRAVYTHGLETVVLSSGDDRFDIPADVLTCLKNPNLHLEVMFHLMAPDTDYPFAWAQQMLERFYDALGPEKLIWGSDIPAAERNVTYRQSMNYVARHAAFMSDADKSLFFGDNLVRLFGMNGAPIPR